MVRRISDKYKANTVSHLKSNNSDISDMRQICNTLAERFALHLIYHLITIVTGLIVTDCK